MLFHRLASLRKGIDRRRLFFGSDQPLETARQRQRPICKCWAAGALVLPFFSFHDV